MLLANVSFFALMMEHDSEPNQLKYPWLPFAVPVIKVACLIIYLVFQDNFFVFLSMYAGGVVYLMTWMAKLTFVKRVEPFEEKMRKGEGERSERVGSERGAKRAGSEASRERL
jgi:hypothetical protein